MSDQADRLRQLVGARRAAAILPVQSEGGPKATIALGSAAEPEEPVASHEPRRCSSRVAKGVSARRISY